MGDGLGGIDGKVLGTSLGESDGNNEGLTEGRLVGFAEIVGKGVSGVGKAEIVGRIDGASVGEFERRDGDDQTAEVGA